ncbi:MAG: glycosyltransferase family 4 protein [Desulfovibrionaceae bacterium]|nr:glycosyltransferase family 4 protein [Desulfovibrionaceae bacterium]
MKILLLDFGKALRGGQRQVFYLLRSLVSVGNRFEAIAACPRNGSLCRFLEQEKLPVLPLRFRSAANPLLYTELQHVVQRFQPDIIHTNDAGSAWAGAVLKIKNPKTLLVHTRRVSYPLKPGIRSWKYHQADLNVGVSREITEGMIQAGIAAEKTASIHSGIDITRYVPHGNEDASSFIFQCIGALTPQKGYSVLIEAVRILQTKESGSWHVRIAGKGPLLSTLQNQAALAGVEEKITFMGETDSRLVLPQCHAVVVPSVDGEGSSATIKEGWVTHVPVICSSLPSNLELVQDQISGLTAQTGNAEALANAMLNCMHNPILRKQVISGGTQALQHFTADHMARSYMRLYEKLNEIKDHSHVSSARNHTKG